MGLREIIAAVLGVALGLVIVAYPDLLVRIHTAGRGPRNPKGEYGEGRTVSERWRLAIRLLGVVCIGFGIAIGAGLIS